MITLFFQRLIFEGTLIAVYASALLSVFVVCASSVPVSFLQFLSLIGHVTSCDTPADIYIYMIINFCANEASVIHTKILNCFCESLSKD